MIDYIAGKVEERKVPFGIGPVAPHISEYNQKETTN